jgi:anti-sigma regulatory factor (Ser/Thr protein kinase)
VTAVGVSTPEYPGGNGDREPEPILRELVLSNDASSVPEARRFVGDFLRTLALKEVEAFDILMALNEAVANAHRHAQPPTGKGHIRVAVGLDKNVLLIEVSDDGPGFEYRPQMKELPDPFASKGRGFFLMSELMDGVDVRSNHGGTTVFLTRAMTSDILASQ